MPFKIGLAQLRHPENGDVVSLVDRVSGKARDAGIDLIVFPESLMTRFEIDRKMFIHEAEPIDGAFFTALERIAKEQGLWIAFTMNERNLHDERPFNTAVIVDSNGDLRGSYRKIHLFDSSNVKESTRMSAGDEVFFPIESPFGKLGLGICYDLRFPELARKQVLEGCEILLYPSAWVEGPMKKLQWEALLRARAIENQIFVAGVCRCDAGYVGSSVVYSPSGDEIARSNGNEEQLVTATIDLSIIAEVRQSIPCLEHRRPKLY